MPWTIGLVWLFLGMFWPLLNWIAAMDVVFQFLRALYYSNTPGNPRDSTGIDTWRFVHSPITLCLFV